MKSAKAATDARRANEYVALDVRQTPAGVLHKYRRDFLADPSRTQIAPHCESARLAPEADDRASLVEPRGSGRWCGKGCQFFPARVERAS